MLLAGAAALVDESGRYQSGGDISSLAPPEPSEEDRKAAVNLSAEPPEKLFRLLAYELFREDKRPLEKRTGIRAFQLATEQPCPDKLLTIAESVKELAGEVTMYHQNVTGTSGLYWLLHQYPDEHSWVWLIAISHERVMRKVGHYFTRLVGFALDDWDSCLSSNFRTVLMSSVATWRKILSDQTALLWNGVAFGLLGDVTSWREVDEEGNAENAPGGPPPNVSWSENLIFGNMWMSSVQKWLEYHEREVKEAVYTELARAQAGMAADPQELQWRKSTDGILSPFEFLRRQLFGGWTLDKGLLRGILRHCLMPGYGDTAPPTVGDFGSGGGRYSEWLNDTGLAEAFAFDATFAANDITGGRVQRANFGKDVKLSRSFDWVLCLDVAGHMSEAEAKTLLSNIRKHAKGGLIMTWRHDLGASASFDFVSLVEQETGLLHDRETTEVVRQGCEIQEVAKSVTVFRLAS